MRQRPTLPGRLQPSTIGVLRLNFCVRNGNRWNPQAITTATGELFYTGAFPCTLTTVYEYRLRSFVISYWSYRINLIKLSTDEYHQAACITALPPMTYLPGSLPGVSRFRLESYS